MLTEALKAVWADNEGYACISTMQKHRPDTPFRNHFFSWPDEEKKIEEFIEDHTDDYDLYWAPALFTQATRSASTVNTISCLWADLDTVKPDSCIIKPSIAWESSPGRYQAIWLLTKSLPAREGEALNRVLTYTVGADKSGWNLSRVLRIPGTRNFKYPQHPFVKLLWSKEDLYYNPDDINNQLKPVDDVAAIDTDSFSISGDTDSLRELIWPYKHILGTRLWELLFTPDSEITPGERSDRLWELEHRLIEAGVPVLDVLEIVKACPWNKFRGRPDEDRRLLTEVMKVEKDVRGSPLAISPSRDLALITYSQLLGKNLPQPGWMIENIWPNNSQGLVAGEPKTYKSIITTEMAICVASGEPMWDRYKTCRTGPVLIIQEENAEWIIQDRLQKIAASKGLLKGDVYHSKDNLVIEFPHKLPIFMLNGFGFDLTSMEHRMALEETISRIQPALVILDPLYLMLGNLDENSAQEVRDTLHWLLQLKSRHHVNLIIVHHWNKGGKSDRGGQRALGTTTFHAWTEAGIYAKVADVSSNVIEMEREYRSYSKPNNIFFRVEMSDPGDPDLFYRLHFLANAKGESAVPIDETAILTTILNNPGCSLKQLITLVGGDYRTVRKEVVKAQAGGLLTTQERGAGIEKKIVSIELTERGIDQLRGKKEEE